MATDARLDFGEDQWLRMPATWDAYVALCKARGEKSRPRYVYVDGWLTAVSPGLPHEFSKKRLGSMIEAVCELLFLDYLPAGSVTLLESARSRTGAEADETYYLTNIEDVVVKKRLVMGEDPPPDLAVEVVVSHPEDDALEAYRRFRIREVWVVKSSGLTFLVLGGDGQYSPSPTSALFPFLTSDELEPWVFRFDKSGVGAVRREFRVWVTETLVPRVRNQG